MGRTINATCDTCGKGYYRRPYQRQYKNGFCSYTCYKISRERKIRACEECNKDFLPNTKKQRFCSRVCAAKGTRGNWSTKKVGAVRNYYEKRLRDLRTAFNFKECMIDGCSYNKTFDIHRYVCGRLGGKYEIGNMFAICPNHHAEIHRKITKVEKVSDCVLKIKEECPELVKGQVC